MESEKNNIIDDLDDKINLLFDYIYNSGTKNCFSVDKIKLGHIGIDDIKISYPTQDNEMEYYNKIKNSILDGRFKLLSYDEKNHQLLFKKYSNQFSVNVKVSFYHNETSINTMESSVNNDSLFSYLLSEVVLRKKSKHILLPLLNLDAKFEDIEKYIMDDPCHEKIKNAIMNNEIVDTCCLQIREHFFRTTNLEDFLNENKCSYKNLLFQIIHTLAVIQKEFPDFRHNQLIPKNVMLYLKKNSKSYTEYEGFKDDKFYLPNEGFDIKITNFENSIIPKHYGLFNAKDNNIKFSDKLNPYYDLFTFLNDLLEGMTKMSRYNNSCDNKTKLFLDKIIPPQIRGLDNKNFNKNIIIAQPFELLYDSFFDEYRKKPENNEMEETFVNHQYLTNKFKTYMDSDNYSELGKQNKIKSNFTIMSNKSKEFSGKRIINKDDNPKLKDNKIMKQVRKLKGGDDTQNTRIENPPYKNERNNPFVSNDQRETFKKRAAEVPTMTPPVLLEQKVYDTSRKPPEKPVFPPSFIPLYDQDGTVANQLLPYSKVINQPPVQKVYNVSLTNPLAGQTTLNRIYEDVLPGQPFSFSSLTIFERRQMIDFLRNNMLENVDGEEMTILGGRKSLLSHLKMLDVNPYTTNKNPYIDLPRNFLLYRSGYPIRFDDKTKNINLAKNSMGLNLRMYMLTIGDLRCKTINNNINSDNFDLWREIKYYDWVKDIIGRKVSPNFIAPVLYKIDSQSKIDWKQLDLLRSKGVPNDTIKELIDNQKKINESHNLIKQGGLLKMMPWTVKNIKVDTKDTKPVDKEDLTDNSGKALILLTESPTSSFNQWASSIYDSFGTVKKMISTGYHSPDIWRAILFQLVYTCAILQKKELYFANMSLDNNFYIKDIFSDSNAIGSWIYKVNDIEYYIPNYGHILMFDSKYADVETDSSLIKKSIDKEQKYKINSPKLYSKNNIDTNLTTLIYNQFKSIINPDNFGHSFKLKGGVVPDKEILDLLKLMYDHNEPTFDITVFIQKYFMNFTHNRIGTLLYKSEKDNINMYYKPNFEKGKLLVWQERYQEFKWVLCVSDSSPSLKKKIITKDKDNLVEIEVFTNSLYSHPDNISPEATKGFKYDESHIYERYNINDL
jgi:hypothetical protein